MARGDPEAALRLLELSTDCILPLSEAHALTGEENAERALRCLAKKTTAQLIVTDGVHGSWALTGDGVLYQPAFAVAAVDTLAPAYYLGLAAIAIRHPDATREGSLFFHMVPQGIGRTI